VKLKQIRHLVDAGSFTTTRIWQRIERELHQGIEAVVWPPGHQRFTINPERKGNGVKPIKEGFVTVLREFGWEIEQKFPPAEGETTTKLPGKLDAMLDLSEQSLAPFAVEWETGNIASSHRAMNKMALALKQRRIVGGILVLPSRALYQYLTDRIGNYEELEPYFSLYTDLEVDYGYLGVIVVEHDAISNDVPRIRKGTDGRALV
jgi:hypothetical protein